MAYGGSQARGFQARGLIRAIAASLRQSHSNASSYTTAHVDAGSLTHYSSISPLYLPHETYSTIKTHLKRNLHNPEFHKLLLFSSIQY